MTDDNEWAPMTGAELAHILDMRGHDAALQEALDDARNQAEDAHWQTLATTVLAQLGADAAVLIDDATTQDGKKQSRLEVLAEELLRARFEEGY